MSRQPRFRPRSGKIYNDHEELRRLNKLVQNKQSRIRTQKGLETVGVETKLIKEFNSRKEFNQYKKKMESFLDKAADFTVLNKHNVEIQYSDILEGEKIVRKINRQKEKQWNAIKDKPFTNRGYQTGMTVEDRANPVYGMGDVKYASFRPVQFDPNKYDSIKGFERRLKTIKDRYDRPNWLEEQNKLYRENYLLAMENNLGVHSKELQEHIKNIPLNEFVEKFYTENNAHIDFVYDLLQVHDRVTELERVWGVA